MADRLQACIDQLPKIDALKPKQIEALEALFAGRDVLAILPTGYGKSLIYQVFAMSDVSTTSSVLVISPLNSIVKEQVTEMIELGISAVHLDPKNEQCLRDIAEGKLRIIFSSAEDCLAFDERKQFHDLCYLRKSLLWTKGRSQPQ